MGRIYIYIYKYIYIVLVGDRLGVRGHGLERLLELFVLDAHPTKNFVFEGLPPLGLSELVRVDFREIFESAPDEPTLLVVALTFTLALPPLRLKLSAQAHNLPLRQLEPPSHVGLHVDQLPGHIVQRHCHGCGSKVGGRATQPCL